MRKSPQFKANNITGEIIEDVQDIALKKNKNRNPLLLKASRIHLTEATGKRISFILRSIKTPLLGFHQKQQLITQRAQLIAHNTEPSKAQHTADQQLITEDFVIATNMFTNNKLQLA